MKPTRTPAVPALLLPAALVEPAWLGADRLAEAAALPGWSAIARRARPLAERGPAPRPPSDPGYERWLHERLALPAEVAPAACASIADSQADAAWRLDPVHLHVGRDHLVLTDPAALALDADDASALAASIATLLADDGLALAIASPGRWYLHERDGARPLALRTRSMLGAIGRNVDAWMPTGDDARRWRRLVNEVQMTWHEHPVNARRAEAGIAPVNSLWIEGRCPGGAAARRAAAAAAGALAVARGAPTEVDAGDAGPVVVDARLLDAHLAGDPQRWTDAWRALDATTFAAIARGEGRWRDGARVVVAGDGGWRELRVAPGADWRFWRRTAGDALLAEPVEPTRVGG